MTVDNLNPTSDVPQARPLPVQPPSHAEEQTWSLLAHLSILLNLITGFAGPIAALVIYLVYRDRSHKIAYHALQALIFQLIFWYGGGLLIGAMWAFVGALSAILIGIILIPFAIVMSLILAVLPIGAVIYGIIGAIQVNQGQDFEYWLVGRWVRNTLRGH
jgi:uncharacterized protein